jgi:hypothetical protein
VLETNYRNNENFIEHLIQQDYRVQRAQGIFVEPGSSFYRKARRVLYISFFGWRWARRETRNHRLQKQIVHALTWWCAEPPACAQFLLLLYISNIFIFSFFLQRSESEVARAHGAAYQVISPISCMLNKFMTLIVRSLFFVRWEKCTYTTFSFGASEEEKSCGSLYNASQTRKSHIAQVCALCSFTFNSRFAQRRLFAHWLQISRALFLYTHTSLFGLSGKGRLPFISSHSEPVFHSNSSNVTEISWLENVKVI